MKRLVLLLALAVVAVSASGCKWFRRGSDCNTCPPTGGGYPAAAPYAAEPYSVGPPVTSSYVPSGG